jgi:hypothetical protein
MPGPGPFEALDLAAIKCVDSVTPNRTAKNQALSSCRVGVDQFSTLGSSIAFVNPGPDLRGILCQPNFRFVEH